LIFLIEKGRLLDLSFKRKSESTLKEVKGELVATSIIFQRSLFV